MATGFLNVAKKVLRQAIRLGVEEAGVRVCGKTGWDAIKAVVAPVIEELERRYPKLMIVPEEMDEAERDLDSDLTLETLVQESLSAVETGKKEILAVLFRNEETLTSYRGLFMHAFEEADRRAEKRHKVLLSEIRSVKTDVQADIQALGAKPSPVVTPSPSLPGLYEQANCYQHDAMTWLTAGRPAVAAERLSIARTLAMGGMARMGESAELMITMGYIEKSQAQVCFAERNLDGATRYLADAARFFNEALKLHPEDLRALNGIANVYFYGGDLDTAIELGRTIMHTDPSYGAAVWDLGLSLEQKIRSSEGTSDPRLLREGIEVDERLVEMMPKQPSVFRSSDLNHVQERLAYYRGSMTQ
jgi:tetratricopeptide (TPR) repeat protein